MFCQIYFFSHKTTRTKKNYYKSKIFFLKLNIIEEFLLKKFNFTTLYIFYSIHLLNRFTLQIYFTNLQLHNFAILTR